MRIGSLDERKSDLIVRAGVLAGAATALGLAARRRTTGAWTGAAALALPLATRGVTGRWPLESTLKNAVPVEVATKLAIEAPAEEVFDAWRRLEELPRILRHVEAVEQLGNGRSRWTAKTPAGEVEWRAEIIEERRPELLRWRSLPGSDVVHEGRLQLHPWRNGHGTLFDLRLHVGAGGRGNGLKGLAGGRTRAAVAALIRPALELEIREDLRRFKSRLEAGEVPTTEGQPSGERARISPTNPL